MLTPLSGPQGQLTPCCMWTALSISSTEQRSACPTFQVPEGCVCAGALTAVLQVTARVLAESGSRPGVGLMPQAGMHAQVAAVVRARLMAQQAQPAGTSNPAAAAQQQAVAGSEASGCDVSVPAGQCAGRVAAPDGELQLLREAGVLPDAHGVYSSLITCMQQQQQLRAEGWNSAQHARLQSAAAGAAALAPGLMVSVLRQQAGVPTVRLVRVASRVDGLCPCLA